MHDFITLVKVVTITAKYRENNILKIVFSLILRVIVYHYNYLIAIWYHNKSR